jgi:hypothetical protein
VGFRGGFCKILLFLQTAAPTHFFTSKIADLWSRAFNVYPYLYANKTPVSEKNTEWQIFTHSQKLTSITGKRDN